MKQYIILSITGAQCAPNTETAVLFNRGEVSKIQRAINRSGFGNSSFDISIYLLMSNAKKPNPRAKKRKWIMTIKNAHQLNSYWGMYQLIRLIFNRFDMLSNLDNSKAVYLNAPNVYTTDGHEITNKTIYGSFSGLIKADISFITSTQILNTLFEGVDGYFSELFTVETVDLDVQKELVFRKRNKNRWAFVYSLLQMPAIKRQLMKQQPRFYKLEFGRYFGRIRYTQSPCYLTKTELTRVIARANNNSAFYSALE